MRSKTVLRSIKKIGPSLAIFMAGAAAMYLSDVLIGRLFPEAVVRRWAITKSSILTLSSFAALGLDQAFVREPSKWSALKFPVLLLVVLISFFGTGVISVFMKVDDIVTLAVAVSLVASSTVFFGVYRGYLKFEIAFLVRDGWKVFFLVGVVVCFLFGFSKFELVIAASATCCLFAGQQLFRRTRSENVREIFNDINSFRSAIYISIPFCLASISLSVAIYSETILLNIFGNSDIIATYYICSVCYISSVVILNSFLSSILSSYVRQYPEVWTRLLTSRPMVLLTCFAVAPICSLILGGSVHILLFSGYKIPLVWAVLMSLTAGLRVAYTVISVTIGALGSAGEILRVSLSYFFCAAMFIVIAFLLTRFIRDAGAAMAAAAAIHWSMRSLVGVKTMRRMLGTVVQPGAA